MIIRHFLCVWLWTFVSAVYKFPSTVKLKNEEYVKVTITEINNRVKRQARSGTTTPNPLPPNNSSSGNSFGSRLLPDLLHISFRLGDKDVHMDLKKRPIRNTPVPMYTSFSDKSLRLHHLSSIKHVGAYYEGVKNNVLMHLECMSNTSSACTHYRMFGTFEHDSDQHFIEPSILPSDLGDDCLFHRVGQPDNIEPFKEILNITKANNVNTPPSNKSSPGKKNKRSRKFRKGKARRKRATGTYIVEIFIIIDKTIYDFWKKEERNSDNMAMLRIRQYYTFLMFGVDFRFRNMRAVYRMRINLVGIYIAKSNTDLTFINKYRRCSGGRRCKLDANRALSDMRGWIITKRIPKHDHIMAFTSMWFDQIAKNGTQLTTFQPQDEMLSGYGDTSGTAYVNSMCTSRSTSIVEDQFDFIAATIAAHEIGHSLGAVHDGDNNRCSRSPGYIMVSVNQAMRRPYHRSPWEFSKCSVEEIGLILDDLDRSKRPNCLRRRHPNSRSYNIGSETRLGQTFNVDKQCELMQGPRSKACRDFLVNTEEVCTGLWCRSTTTSRGEVCIMSLPAEGTSCGHNKWCVGYECRFDSRAPRINAGCIFGDRPGTILRGQTCSNLIRREPWQCYSRSIRKNCCESCYRIKTRIKNCEYGDKSPDCPMAKRLGRCSRYRSQCCKSCR